jgi:bis(5'-nucleosyl)-tetraphosphatase (symmetrical)
MSDYLIGDVQGCYDALQILLKKSRFSLDKDRLFFLGDVVNRGNKSLETLRFIRNLGDNAKMLLGNHDFHLLACALGDKTPSNKDTFNDILNAKDAQDLIGFLQKQQQPVFIKGKMTFFE